MILSIIAVLNIINSVIIIATNTISLRQENISNERKSIFFYMDISFLIFRFKQYIECTFKDENNRKSFRINTVTAGYSSEICK